MKRTIILALALVAAVAAGQAQAPERSRVETKTIDSTTLGAQRSYSVYLPAGYDADAGKKYPVLYLLHGLSGDHTNWFQRGHARDVADQLIAAGEACEMIIVSPEAGGVEGEVWNGYFDMPGWSYEKFFFNELLPRVESEYRVAPGRENRAIAGLSMGGGGATVYAQHHPEMFSSVYAMSALMALPDSEPAGDGGNGSNEPGNEPGEKMMALYSSVREHNCIEYVRRATEAQKEQLRTIAWTVDCGDDDFLLDVNIDFTRAMRAAAVPAQFRVRDGGHTWEYWHSALYSALPFASRNFKPIAP